MKKNGLRASYGNSGIIIATPEVLKRKDAAKEVGKDAMALVKEMQLFEYGGYFDDYYITIATLKYKQEAKIDLDKALEGGLQGMEAKGAQDIIIKTEDFNTRKDFPAVKPTAPSNMVDKITRRSVKVYYEFVIFSQEGGLQQVLMFHKEGDEYGSKISARILESIELRKAAP